MFDIGFAELLLIGVIGLLVLGPERLPRAVRTVSLWLGRLRRGFNDIRREIEREINADEIRQDLHNESIMKSLKQAEQDLRRGLEEPVEETPPAPDPTPGDEETPPADNIDSGGTAEKP